MTPFDLVIFDHDGVLVDSEIIAMDLIAQIVTEHGHPMTVDEAIHTFLGTSLDAVAESIREHGGVVDMQVLDATFHARLFDGFRERLVAIPGIPELLTALADQGIPVCIASSGTRERVTLGVTTTGLQTFFDPESMTTREDVTRGKPHPDLFELAASRAQIPPERCLVIEDSPHGVEAARRAGMRVVGLSYRTPAAALSEADWVVTDPSAILAIVRGQAPSP